MSKSICLNQTQGRRCEELVCQYFRKKGWEILSQGKKIAGVQVDLVVRSQNRRMLLVEVKSLSQQAWLDHRVSAKQRQRLARATQALVLKFGGSYEVQFCLATVDHDGKVQFFADIW